MKNIRSTVRGRDAVSHTKQALSFVVEDRESSDRAVWLPAISPASPPPGQLVQGQDRRHLKPC